MASLAKLSNSLSKTTTKLELLRLTFAFEKVQRKREPFCHAYFFSRQMVATARPKPNPSVCGENRMLLITTKAQL